MDRFKKIVIILIFLIPVLLAFKNFWDISNPLVWGDAPYFFAENLNELFNKPFAWDIRNSNFGNSQLLTLWLYIPTALMGFLFNFFAFSHELSIRLVFYLPFLVFGSLGIWLTLSKFKLSSLARAFGILLYILNSYSVLLVDGGQIGVLLSYGLFPFCFYLFLRLLKIRTLNNFLTTLLFHFLIFNTDLRIGLVLILLEVIWSICLVSEKSFKQLITISTVYLLTLLLCGFWIVPFIKGVSSGNLPQTPSSLPEFTELINSFYLFQPHFPENDFGNLNKTPVYYIFLPIILFLGLLRKDKSKKLIILTILFLLFTFLAKGSNYPFGEIYAFIVNNLPLAGAFRDSTKFYIPALFISSILLGHSIDFLKNLQIKFKYIWICLVYVFLLTAVYPIFIGGLTGVLKNESDNGDFFKIENLVENNKGFRSLWFREKPSMGYADWDNPPISANTLFQERPFASMIDGEYDLFGFLHNKNISDWYELLGVKYIFYPPYEREKSLTKKEQLERIQFEKFISEIQNLEKVDIGATFPIHKTNNPQPKIFLQEKIFFVVGGDEIYEKLFKLKNFTLENNSLVFLESCLFNPQTILNLDPKSFTLISTGDLNDLHLSFFCDNFISTKDSVIKEWAINDSGKYLNWKSQLLERGIRNYDYDFNRGVAYSTNENEKLEFDIKVDENDSYYLPIRYLTASQSGGIKVNFANIQTTLKSQKPNKLEWEILGPLKLEKGDKKLRLTNLGNIVVLNTLGLISQKTFDQKKEEINHWINSIEVVNGEEQFNSLTNIDLMPIDFKMLNPTEYELNIATSSSWLVFSERFDNNWKLMVDTTIKEPLPFYSLINGYYIKDLDNSKRLKLYYQPQDSVDRGLILTGIGLFIAGFVMIINIIRYGSYKIRQSNSKN